MDQLIKKYKAVSQVCRFRILYLLLKSGTPLCICEMMDSLEKQQYQISRCLSILKDAGLIDEQREGRLLLYFPRTDHAANQAIFSALRNTQSHNNPILTRDLIRLKERLSLRQEGKIVITYTN